MLNWKDAQVQLAITICKKKLFKPKPFWTLLYSQEVENVEQTRQEKKRFFAE